MNAKDRIIEYLDSKGLSIAKMESELGWGNGGFAKTKSISTEKTIEFLLRYTEVSAEWLLRGEGEMCRSKEECPIMNFDRGKPYYNVDFMCGFDLVENDQTTNPDCLIWFPMYDKADCWCNATGMSMYPDICPGDIIALKEVQNFKSYLPLGEIYGVVTREHRTIKKICKSEKKGFVKLVPTNQSRDFSEQDIPLDMIVRVYRVLGSLRRF